MNTIVWIDEDSDLLRSAIEPLEWVGYRVIRLHSLCEARAALREISRADLLLLELLLPLDWPSARQTDAPNGIALLEELRASQVTAPAVVFTAMQDAWVLRSLQTTAHLGVCAVIRKPALPSELKQVVEDALRATRSPGQRSNPTPPLR